MDTNLDVVLTCPLGSECEEIKDNKVHRCRWYVMVKGVDAQGTEHNNWNCSHAWASVLTLELAGEIRKTNASIQSMRNSQDKRQEQAIDAINKNMIGDGKDDA